MSRPERSPYYHLIPEVKEMRRRRNWNILLGVAMLVFLGIGVMIWKDRSAPSSARSGQGDSFSGYIRQFLRGSGP